MSENVYENMNEAVEEMKEQASLSDTLRGKTKFAERDIETYLNYEAALRCIELQDEISDLQYLIEKEEHSGAVKSITDDPISEYRVERDKKTEELQEQIKIAKNSRAVWKVRGVPPKVWKAVDKSARQKFPLTQEADEHTKVEVQLKRNDFVNAETLKTGLVRVEFASGEVYENITSEEANMMWEELPLEVLQPVKDKIDELTFSNLGFQEYLESADFLSSN